MELTGLQIFKYLPGGKRTENANCKKCKQPTCMAYALKLAKKQVEPNDCPYIPEELLALVLESSKKQQNEIVFGQNNKSKIGGETVMFRHEKTFVNKVVIAITLDCDKDDFEEKYKKIKNYKIERVGDEFKVETIYLSGNKNLIETAKKLSEEGFSLIIKSDDAKIIDELKELNPIFETTQIGDKNCKYIVSGDNIEQIAERSSALQKNNIENIVLNLDISNKPMQKIVEEMTYIRRFAIQNRDERFAHPIMVKLFEQGNISQNLVMASTLVCKYASLIVLDNFDYAMLTSLYTLRQNIYTDPQKPLQVEPKIYEFNEPDENAIIMMTTNFALTYFAVANEIESMGRPTYLVVTPSDGMSVLTAWSADKFTSELAAKTLKDFNLAQRVKNRKIIIPGLLAHMKDELQEELKEWEIVVGPIEAYQLPEFVKNNF